jgi:hypothetical protein
MPNAMLPRLGAIAMGAILLTAAYHRINPASVMTEAANRFLASLTPEQRAQASFKFEDDERVNWHFIPKPRKGLPLLDMASYQKHLATALLSAGLSQQGFMKAVTIMSLDDVLKVMENDNGQRRNPEKYYFSIFGTPSDQGVWGYRVEGHHLSQNYTVVNGRVVDAPSFFGSNPAEVRQGPRKGLRTLAQEDDLGHEVIASLDAEQKKVAIVDQVAYKDIITLANRTAALEGQPSGLSASKMNSKQFEALMALQRGTIGALSAGGSEAGVGARPVVRCFAPQNLCKDQSVFGLRGTAVSGGSHAQSPHDLLWNIANPRTGAATVEFWR